MTDDLPGRRGDDARLLPAEEADVAALAAGLGVTAERLLTELAIMAFARITDLIEWDDSGLRLKSPDVLAESGKAAAIAEVVTSAKGGRPYRVKQHDKRGAIDLLCRCIGLLPKLRPGASRDEATDDDGDDPFGFIIRELDRRVAARRLGLGYSKPEPAEGAEAR